MKSTLILRFNDVYEQPGRLRRLIGTVPGASFIQLIDVADLTANPRNAKPNNVTDAIRESLDPENEVDLFHFKTKGVLIAASQMRPLERQRYELIFDEPNLEGILDGGHNTLAIAMKILEWVGASKSELSSIKRWDQLPDLWKTRRPEIDKLKEQLTFLVPVEVILPKDNSTDAIEDFNNAILEIAKARNNNVQLKEEAQANKAGYYDYLRAQLEERVRDKVEWKTNDGGRIKVRELIALSWIPLLETELPEGSPVIRPTNIYNSKAACVDKFTELMKVPGVCALEENGTFSLQNEHIKSALNLMSDLPRLYDLIYELLPSGYNHHSPRFGGISCVVKYDPEKSVSKKITHRPVKTKFTGKPVDYDYPDGFVIPLVYGLTALIEKTPTGVRWKTDPEAFIRKNINAIMERYKGLIEMSKYDPQALGKNSATYPLTKDIFKAL